MSTFSDTGSLRITSGAIQATVPANDILVLLSLSSFEVPKSEIFTRSSCVISMLQRWDHTEFYTEIIKSHWWTFRCCIGWFFLGIAQLRWLTWGTWGLGGWFCGDVGSSCHPRCPWTSQPGGRGWFYGLPSAPHTVGLGRNIPSGYSNKEPGCTRP